MLRRRAARQLADARGRAMLADLRAAAAARQRARQFAEFRAAAEDGQWFVVYTGNWENRQYEQERGVAWGRLKAQHPANWWDYDLPGSRPGELEWLEIRLDWKTRPYPQPAPAPQPAAARDYWSPGPRPACRPPVQLTASQNQAQNANGSTARNLARNRGGNAY
jgi:hypothetical protein